jgi:bifunctional non-homologous end joining protein LigD
MVITSGDDGRLQVLSVEIAQESRERSWWHTRRESPLRCSGRMSLPEWIVPMAATLTDKRFTAPQWIFERKFDGIRLLTYKQGRDVKLFSRNRLPQHLPAIARAVADVPLTDAILDGEVTWDGQTAYHVFDLVWADGRDLRMFTLEHRRAALLALPLPPPLHHVDVITEPEPWQRACQEGWEGVIAKHRESHYESRRSPHWLKMKCELTADFIVGGFTDPQGGRVGLGALLVGRYQDGQFVFAGKVGTGFDTRLLQELRARLDLLEIPQSPFTRAVGLPRLRAHWVRPEIVVNVAFIEWTVHGKLRHSRLRKVTS